MVCIYSICLPLPQIVQCTPDVEVDGVEVDGVEVDGAEVDSVEVDGVEVDGVEVDSVEVDDEVTHGCDYGMNQPLHNGYYVLRKYIYKT